MRSLSKKVRSPFLVLWALIILASTNIQAQNTPLLLNSKSNLISTVPAFVGYTQSNHTGISYTHSKINNSLFRSVFVQQDWLTYRLGGAIGLTCNSDLVNTNVASQSASASYAYHFRISRNWSLKPAIRVAGNQVNKNTNVLEPRLDLNSATEGISDFHSKQNYWSIGSGFLLHSEKWFLGFNAANLNKPIEATNELQEMELPIEYAAITGYKFGLHRRSVHLMPVVGFNQQERRLAYDSMDNYMLNSRNNLSVQINYFHRSWISGLGHQTNFNNFNSFNAQLGYKTHNLTGIVNFGIVPHRNSKQEDLLGSQVQFTLEYKFYTARRPMKYRALHCPDFGSSSSGTAYNIKRPSAYSSSSSGSKQIYKWTGRARGDQAVNPSNGYTVAKPKVKAGTLTGSELNDFAKWNLWKDINETSLGYYNEVWNIKPEVRYSVQIQNLERRVVSDATVNGFSTKGTLIWSAKSDNTGKVELWSGLFDSSQRISYIEVSIKGQSDTFHNIHDFEKGVNIVTLKSECEISNALDIMFMVDATGSMGDEIKFLQQDLKDIIQKTKSNIPDVELNMASLFYRCVGNEYTTRGTPFTQNVDSIVRFIEKQEAGEGGIEAVEIALDEAVNNYEWSESARARILFLVLDEPPGSRQDQIKTLDNAIQRAAAKGIRIVPIVSSGLGHQTDKSLEYLMRSFALATNGTYVFLTDHSGVGNKHTPPTTDSYDVELLNQLIIRIIKQQSLVLPCDQTYKDIQAEFKDTVRIEIIDHVVLDSSKISEPKDSVLAHIPHKIDSLHSRSDTLASQDSLPQAEAKDTLNAPRKSITCFPNPNFGLLNIRIEGDVNNLFICDANGKILQKVETQQDKEIQVDLSRYPVGYYFVQYGEGPGAKRGKILLLSR